MSENGHVQLRIEDVVFREDLYPRKDTKPALAQKYAENLILLPPIEVNQDNILIDGWHRWMAHRIKDQQSIRATVTRCEPDDILLLAAERNAEHGDQLSYADKRRIAQAEYRKTPMARAIDKKKELARRLSVAESTLHNWLNTIDRDRKEERNALIAEMYLACHTQEEIATAVGMSQRGVGQLLEQITNMEFVLKVGDFEEIEDDTERQRAIIEANRARANHADDFQVPLYTVWTYASKSNAVSHFGNTEQAIVDNLLYLYTEPWDIIVDPFAGGGSTIDVCKHRLRRYWVGDRKPIPARENEIHKHDVVTDGVPPLHRNWSEVSLTYLDPPYWKQAEGRYSDDPTDLANMPLEEFTESLAQLVKEISKRQSKGVIALIIQPTQWNAPGRQFTDHVNHIINAVGNKRLTLDYRVSCPYSTEQYNAQQVNWAKENRELLVISRELIIWRVGE